MKLAVLALAVGLLIGFETGACVGAGECHASYARAVDCPDGGDDCEVAAPRKTPSEVKCPGGGVECR